MTTNNGHSADLSFLENLRSSIKLACSWLVDVAQVQGKSLTHSENTIGIQYDNWSGAIRGEYRASTREWRFYCPFWHSSQAAKALLMAEDAGCITNGKEAALKIGDFLLHNRISDASDPDYGLLLAFEDAPHLVNTSAILESIDALFALTDATQDDVYENAALAALKWVANKQYQKGRGVFDNHYDPAHRRVEILHKATLGLDPEWRFRPLLDDAVYLKGYQRSGDSTFRKIFYETAERLLETEMPAGNWIRFRPCHQHLGRIHPRHAYWWGMPLIDAWLDSGDARYQEAALRSAEWYKNAIRKDGGLFRATYDDFNSDSFGHATSGAACASILFQRVAGELGETRFLPLVEKILGFCMQMQFVNPSDPNLKGAILEKVLPPNGTDASPYHLRDLGTIFFVNAASRYLLSQEQCEGAGRLNDEEIALAAVNNH